MDFKWEMCSFLVTPSLLVVAVVSSFELSFVRSDHSIKLSSFACLFSFTANYRAPVNASWTCVCVLMLMCVCRCVWCAERMRTSENCEHIYAPFVMLTFFFCALILHAIAIAHDAVYILMRMNSMPMEDINVCMRWCCWCLRCLLMLAALSLYGSGVALVRYICAVISVPQQFIWLHASLACTISASNSGNGGSAMVELLLLYLWART